MVAAVVEVVSRSGVRRSNKLGAKQACPNCANRIEQFSVDTNCKFRMCSNTSCTWPFDSGDMETCFEHDATVPSIRKRAKRRKAQATREERRIKRRQSEAQGQMGVTNSTESVQALDPPITRTNSGIDLLSTSLPNTGAALTDWLAGLCNDGSTENTGLQGKYKQNDSDLTCADNGALPANWLETLLAGSASASTAVTQSCDLRNGLTASSSLSPVVDSITQTSNGPVDANVADLFAAFNSAVNTTVPLPNLDDAVIPHTTRHPSPATSESAGDEVDSHTPLSSGELELLITGKSSDSRNVPHPQQQSMVSCSAVGSGSSYLDSLTMLLSPPESATTGPSLPSAKQGSDSTLDLLGSQPWSAQSDTTVTAQHGLLDFNHLLASSTASAPNFSQQLPVGTTAGLSVVSQTTTPGFASDVASPLDANSIIENIFGTSSKLTPNVL
ncbi:hypothetical protein COEREDRAFT_82284 [Coemansia reversa NRRL 1564]|uniref:Uncharacterized protein n=1 Tax=Coemansia reversa (strain ATCC 12441 / NRRL 1564) TaxID=763665 RepID=A0A2G5B7T7_COERN|nr:hypothetical protein COEREDRAFT_82284 [Coemansia reversa NRRL 1564]|eukprot:PIA15078.1 hypothetical protein COEREDRAFT_82284 [Coemansia reversa NRRL 1564]